MLIEGIFNIQIGFKRRADPYDFPYLENLKAEDPQQLAKISLGMIAVISRR